MSTPLDSTRSLGGPTPGWMLVQLGESRVALPIDAVGEVLPVPDVSPVPMVPDWVLGLASVRGEVVPVVDAGLRLFGRAAARTGRLVLTHPDDAGERVGLLVDGIAGLVERGAEPGVAVLDLAALIDPEADVAM